MENTANEDQVSTSSRHKTVMDTGTRQAILEWINAIGVSSAVESLSQLQDGKLALEVLHLIEPSDENAGIESPEVRYERLHSYLKDRCQLPDPFDIGLIVQDGNELEIATAFILLLCYGVRIRNESIIRPALSIPSDHQVLIHALIEHLISDTLRYTSEGVRDMLKNVQINETCTASAVATSTPTQQKSFNFNSTPSGLLKGTLCNVSHVMCKASPVGCYGSTNSLHELLSPRMHSFGSYTNSPQTPIGATNSPNMVHRVIHQQKEEKRKIESLYRQKEAELRTKQSELDAEKDLKTELELELNVERSALNEKELEIKDLRNEILDLRKEHDDITELQARNQKLESDLERFKQRLLEFNDTKGWLAFYKTENEDLQNQALLFKSENKQLQTKQTSLVDLRRQSTAFKLQVNDLELVKKHNEARLSTITSERDALWTQVKEMKEQLSRQQIEFDELLQQNIDGTGGQGESMGCITDKKLFDIEAELEQMRSTWVSPDLYQKAVSESQEAQEARALSESKWLEIRKSLLDCETQCDVLQATLSEKAADLAMLGSSCRSLKAELTEREVELSEAQHRESILNESHHSLKETRQTLQNGLEEKERDIARLHVQIDFIVKERDTEQEQQEVYRQTMTESINSALAKHKSLKQQLEQEQAVMSEKLDQSHAQLRNVRAEAESQEVLLKSKVHNLTNEKKKLEMVLENEQLTNDNKAKGFSEEIKKLQQSIVEHEQRFTEVSHDHEEHSIKLHAQISDMVSKHEQQLMVLSEEAVKKQERATEVNDKLSEEVENVTELKYKLELELHHALLTGEESSRRLDELQSRISEMTEELVLKQTMCSELDKCLADTKEQLEQSVITHQQIQDMLIMREETIKQHASEVISLKNRLEESTLAQGGQENEIQQLTELVATKIKELAEKEDELGSLQARVSQLETTTVQSESKTRALEAEISMRVAEFQELKQNYEEKCEEVLRKSNELVIVNKEKDEIVEKQQEQVNSLTNNVESKSNDLIAKECAILDLEKTISCMAEQITQRNTDLEKLSHDFQEKDNNLCEKVDCIRSLELTINEKSNSISELETTMNGLNQSLDAKSQEVLAKDSQIEVLQTNIVDLNNEISSKVLHISEVDALHNSTVAELEQRTRNVQQLTEELQRINNDLKLKDKQIDDFACESVQRESSSSEKSGRIDMLSQSLNGKIKELTDIQLTVQNVQGQLDNVTMSFEQEHTLRITSEEICTEQSNRIASINSEKDTLKMELQESNDKIASLTDSHNLEIKTLKQNICSSETESEKFHQEYQHLCDVKEQLRIAVDESQVAIQELNVQLQGKQSEISEKNERVESLSQSLDQKSSEFTVVQTDMTSLQSQFEEQCKKTNCILSENQALKSQLEKYTNRIEEQDLESNAFKESTSSLQTEVERQYQEAQVVRQEKEQLRIELDESKSIISELAAKQEQKDIEMLEMTKRLEILSEELTQKCAELAEAQTSLHNLQCQLEKVSHQATEDEQSLRSRYESQLNEQNSKTEHISAERIALETELDELKQQQIIASQRHHDDKQQLESELEASKNKVMMLTEKHDNEMMTMLEKVTAAKTVVDIQLHETRARYENSEAQLSQLQRQFTDKETTMATRIQDLEKQLSKNEDTFIDMGSSMRKLQDEIERLTENEENLTSRIQELEKQLSKNEDTFIDMGSSMRKLQDEREGFTDNEESLTSRILELEKQLSKNEDTFIDMGSSMRKLQDEREGFTDNEESLTSRILELEKQLSKNEDTFIDMGSSMRKLQDEREGFTDNEESLTSRILELEKQLSKNEDTFIDMGSSMRKLQDEREGFTDNEESLTSRILELEKQLSKNEDTFIDMGSLIQKLQDERDGMMERVQELEKQLSKNEDTFIDIGSSMRKLQDEREGFNDNEESLKSRIQELEKQLSKNEDTFIDMGRAMRKLQDERERFLEELSHKDNHLSACRKQIDELQQTYDSVVEEKELLNSCNVKLSDDISNMHDEQQNQASLRDEQLALLGSSIKEKELSMVAEADRLRKDISQKVGVIEEFKQMQAETISKIQNLGAQTDNLQKKYDEMVCEKDAIITDITNSFDARLKANQQLLGEEFKGNQQKHSEDSQKLSAELMCTRQRENSLQETLETMKKELQKIDDEKSEVRKQMTILKEEHAHEMESVFSDKESQLAEARCTYETMLTDVNIKLEQQTREKSIFEDTVSEHNLQMNNVEHMAAIKLNNAIVEKDLLSAEIASLAERLSNATTQLEEMQRFQSESNVASEEQRIADKKALQNEKNEWRAALQTALQEQETKLKAQYEERFNKMNRDWECRFDYSEEHRKKIEDCLTENKQKVSTLQSEHVQRISELIEQSVNEKRVLTVKMDGMISNAQQEKDEAVFLMENELKGKIRSLEQKLADYGHNMAHLHDKHEETLRQSKAERTEALSKLSQVERQFDQIKTSNSELDFKYQELLVRDTKMASDHDRNMKQADEMNKRLRKDVEARTAEKKALKDMFAKEKADLMQKAQDLHHKNQQKMMQWKEAHTNKEEDLRRQIDEEKTNSQSLNNILSTQKEELRSLETSHSKLQESLTSYKARYVESESLRKKLAHTVRSQEAQLDFADRQLRESHHGESISKRLTEGPTVFTPHSSAHALKHERHSSDELTNDSLNSDGSPKTRMSTPYNLRSQKSGGDGMLTTESRGVYLSLPTLPTPQRLGIESTEPLVRRRSCVSLKGSNLQRQTSIGLVNAGHDTPGGGPNSWDLSMLSLHSNGSTDTVTSTGLPRGTGSLFPCEDEPNDPFNWGRLDELQRRNTLCLPHQKTSYPVEMQLRETKDISEDALRKGAESTAFAAPDASKLIMPTRQLRKRRSDTMDTDLSTEHGRRNFVKSPNFGTAYHKPGPPTPANPRAQRVSECFMPLNEICSQSPRTSIASTTAKSRTKQQVNQENDHSNVFRKESVTFDVGFTPKSKRLTRQTGFVSAASKLVRKPLAMMNLKR